MKDQKEIQSAWKIFNLIEKLNHLLWNRYENDFIEIYLREEDDKFLRTIGHPSLTNNRDKTEGGSKINPAKTELSRKKV